jgi:hypothetical protein
MTSSPIVESKIEFAWHDIMAQAADNEHPFDPDVLNLYSS